jgi:hypothetical protein
MSGNELLALLSRSRAIHERYLFDGEQLRDDVAEICMAIDDVLSNDVPAQSAEAMLDRGEIERSAA